MMRTLLSMLVFRAMTGLSVEAFDGTLMGKGRFRPTLIVKKV